MIHTPSEITCPICGKVVPQKFIIIYDYDDKNAIACDSCAQHMGTCTTCQYGSQCGFTNDHSEPQIVNKTIQRGPMRMQTQIKNPNLVNKHCVKCRCGFDDGTPNIDPVCLKDENGINCNHYSILPQLLY